jgi:hypothetical protein
MSQTTTHAPARSKVPPVYPALSIEAIRESYADHLRARTAGKSKRDKALTLAGMSSDERASS